MKKQKRIMRKLGKNREKMKKNREKCKKNVKNEKNYEKIKKHCEKQCPLGNRFSGNVFQDLSVSVRSIFGKCSFRETHSRL